MLPIINLNLHMSVEEWRALARQGGGTMVVEVTNATTGEVERISIDIPLPMIQQILAQHAAIERAARN